MSVRRFVLLGRGDEGKAKVRRRFERLLQGQRLHDADPLANPNPERFENINANTMEEAFFNVNQLPPQLRRRNKNVTNLCYAIITRVKLNTKLRVKTTMFRPKGEEKATHRDQYQAMIVFR